MKKMRRPVAAFLAAVLLFSLLDASVVWAAGEEAGEEEPLVYQLDENNRDEQGILYTLNEESRVAIVGTNESGSRNNSGYQGANKGKVVLPDIVEKEGEQYYVTWIGKDAFGFYSDIKSIIVPDSVLRIETSAFEYCGLEEVWLGKGVYYGDEMFRFSDNLKTIEVDKENRWYESHDGILYSRKTGDLVCMPDRKEYSGDTYQLPEGVKQIGWNSCYGARNIRTIILPDSVKSISSSAFHNSELAGINLENITYMGRYAFRNTHLTSVVVGEDTKQDTDWLGGNTFEGCEQLRFVDHKSPILVRDEFKNCDNLQTVLLAEDTETIPEETFYNCRKLKSIYIPRNVRTIDPTAFLNCTDLVIYGEAGTAACEFAHDNAFEFVDVGQCDHDEETVAVWEDSFVEVTGRQCSKCNYTKYEYVVKDTLKAGEGSMSLEGELGDKEFYPPENELRSLNSAKRDSYGLEYSLNGQAKTATLISSDKYMGKGCGEIEIPAYVSYQGIGYKVTGVGTGAFNSNQWVISIKVADTVQSVGENAFRSCNYLEKIYLGKAVKDLDASTFIGSDAITYLEIAKDNPWLTVRDRVIYDKQMTKLIYYMPQKRKESFVVPEGVTTIAEQAFYKSDIGAVFLPESVSSLEEHAFSLCKMKYINLEHVKTIDYCAIYSCPNLKSIYLKDVESLNSFAYGINDCENLECVYIEGNVRLSLNFNACDNLKSIIIKCRSVTGTAGPELDQLKYVILSDGLKFFPQKWLSGFSSLEKIYIPDDAAPQGDAETDLCKNMVWYTKEGSAASVYASQNGIQQRDTTGHTHHLEPMVYYEDEYVIVRGKYCEECGYGTGHSYKTKAEGRYPGETPDPAPDITEHLDAEGEDRYGIFYVLDEKTMTAVAGDGREGSFYYDGRSGGNIVLPSFVEEYGNIYEVIGLNDYLFYNNKNLVSVTVPNTCQSIGNNTFSGSTMQKLEIGTGLQFIKNNTLGALPELSGITVNDANAYWRAGDGILYNKEASLLVCCPAANEGIFYIPDSVTEISDYAFYGSGYSRVILNSSLRQVGERAFCASSLTGIELESSDLGSVLDIGRNAFADCGKLQWCWIGKGVSLSDQGIFSGCTGLHTVFFFYNQTEINDILGKNPSVRNLVFLSGVTGNCSNFPYLEKLILNRDAMEYLNGFSNCPMLKRVYLPVSVTEIHAKTLSGAHEDLTIAGVRGGGAEKFATGQNYGFTEIESHSHSLEEFIFYEDGMTKLSCLYCEKCGYATKVQKEDKGSGTIVIVETDDYSQGENPAPTPTAGPTESPVPTPTVGPTEEPEPTPPAPTPTVKPTEKPEPTPTVKPTESPVPTPTVGPTEEPVPTPTAEPMGEPAPTPTAEPAESPTPTPAVIPTAASSEKPVPVPTATPAVVPTLPPAKIPYNPQELLKPSVVQQVTGLHLGTKDNKTIQISWRAVAGEAEYQIYRKDERAKKYRKIAVVKNPVCLYRDRTVKADRKYSYKIRVVGGMDSAVRTFSVNGMGRPVFSAKKGKKGGTRYITIRLKRYTGTHIQIYMKKKKGKYKKIKLKSDRIKKYGGKFKLRYKMKKKTLSFRIRTYRKKGKKKIISLYSGVKKIRI